MKKRIFALLTAALLLVSIAACKNKIQNNETTDFLTADTIFFENSTQTRATQNIDLAAPNYETNDSGGGYIESDKYRLRYYAIPYNFVSLVDYEEYLSWKEDILKQSENETNVMRMVKFIKHFNISREVFEKVNLQMAKEFVEWGEKPTMKPLDYENQQTYEVYNADIIYTFDDEIINEYYLTPDYPYCAEFEYENALEAGTYQTQTIDWIDIEQMEAEIIAKYGEAEIVTEASTIVAEETSTVISEETETTA